MSDDLKVSLASSLNGFVQRRMNDQGFLSGKAFPVSVVSRDGQIVTVKFELVSAPWTLPNVTIPIAGSEYTREPIAAGCMGYAASADALLGGVTGLGAGTASISSSTNLSALVFVPLGNKNFMKLDETKWWAYASSNCLLSIGDDGANISGPNGNLTVEGNLSAGNGITCSFTTPTGQVVTVTDGIVTNLY